MTKSNQDGFGKGPGTVKVTTVPDKIPAIPASQDYGQGNDAGAGAVPPKPTTTGEEY